MAPTPHVATHRGSGFIHFHRQATIQQVSGCGRLMPFGRETTLSTKETSGCLFSINTTAAGVNAAFIGEKRNQTVHHRIVRPANQRRYLPFLRDHTYRNQLAQVVR
jgi:hypothetical protein